MKWLRAVNGTFVNLAQAEYLQVEREFSVRPGREASLYNIVAYSGTKAIVIFQDFEFQTEAQDFLEAFMESLGWENPDRS